MWVQDAVTCSHTTRVEQADVDPPRHALQLHERQLVAVASTIATTSPDPQTHGFLTSARSCQPVVRRSSRSLYGVHSLWVHGLRVGAQPHPLADVADQRSRGQQHFSVLGTI
jgi:hypothetical protein